MHFICNRFVYVSKPECLNIRLIVEFAPKLCLFKKK